MAAPGPTIHGDVEIHAERKSQAQSQHASTYLCSLASQQLYALFLPTREPCVLASSYPQIRW